MSFTKIPKFRRFVLQNFPFIEEDFDALTDYGLICKVVQYLNTVINQTNANTEQIAQLNEAFEALQQYVEHYFDNLDVQNEINNKLDQMASDGSLFALINAYVQPEIDEINASISTAFAAQNSAIADIRSEVQAVASGSPAGVYATTDALTAADPDHSKIYLVSADGKWYYYNGAAWTAGGTYQAAVLTLDDTLTSSSDAPVSKVVGKAVINITNSGTVKTDNNISFTWESGTIGTNGTETTETKRVRTVDYIFVKAGSFIYCESGYKFGYAIYDLPYSSSFVSRTNINTDGKTVENDCYIRLIMGTTGEAVIVDPSTVTPYLHFFISPAVNTNEFEKNVNPVDNSGICQLGAQGWFVTENANNSFYKLNVNEGEIYHIKYTYTRGEPSLIIVDNETTLVYQVPFAGSNDQREYYIVIPAGSYEMVINHNINYPASIYKVESIGSELNKTAQTLNNVRILHTNAGGFNYGDGTTSNEQYIKNWKKMLNDNPMDILCFCEWENTFNSQNMNSELVAPLMRNINKGHQDLLLTAYKGNIVNLGVLTVTNQVGDLTTWAYHALKSKITLGNKDLYIYECHLAYSAGYEAIRQEQYRDLINDAINNGYEYVIFIGDFNAQVIGEYDIFKDNGYNLCNGGYTGAYNTLRDITADNIIYSNNIKLNKFEVLTDYNLNTDHKPIIAELNF